MLNKCMESVYCHLFFKKCIFLFDFHKCFRGKIIPIFWEKKTKSKIIKELGREVTSWSPPRPQ